MKHYNSLLAVIFILLIGCYQPKISEEETAKEKVKNSDFQFNWQGITDTLMFRMNLQPGEKVFLLANPHQYDTLIRQIKKAVQAEGAEYLGAIAITEQQPPDWQTTFTKKAVVLAGEQLEGHLAGADIGIMMPGATPGHKVYAAMQNVLRSGRARTIHFHWAGAYDTNMNSIPLDTPVHIVYQNALLKTDYKALSERQGAFVEAMRNNQVSVTTPSGTDLTFKIGDRPVNVQNGDASKVRTGRGQILIDREIELPAGVIRVAPIEESVNGTIAFPDATWAGKEAKGVVLTIEEGKVVDVSAEEGLEHVKKELENGKPAAYAFREFALGFNPHLKLQTGENGKKWIPYYAYGNGLVRLSLGDNTELGGNVSGGYVRWNFFTDASVKVGDEWWVKNGEVVKE
ncbi:MAG: aminopeptidase [Fulvivirga sp.]|nr:aminopeptidase [Fulvivirga sp.]